MMGQTPPPWHGQAVATQILFDADWPDFEVDRLRMEFSGEMEEVGRFQFRKLWHLWDLIRKARRILRAHPGCVLFYPPASAKWVPFLRDVIFLNAVRHLAGSTVFIFHASGLPVFAERNWLTRLLSWRAYHGADVSLEVAQEAVPPHRVFQAWDSAWCPCAIAVGEASRSRGDGGPLVALFVASLQEGKGVLEILRTAKALKDKGRGGDFHFRIVGKWFSADFEREARQMHEEFALGEMVEFVGQLTGDEKWQAYADADVFFFPTHYASEATPIVIMEALGMGLHVLSTEWAGIPAMLEGCKTASLLPIRSPEAYATALEAMADDPEARHATRKNAMAFYQDRFLPERFIARVANAFHKAVKPEKRKSGKAQTEDPESGVRDQGSSDLSPLPWITDHCSPITAHRPSTSDSSSPPISEFQNFSVSDFTLSISIYLADQNPKLGRSLGISRMTEVVMREMCRRPRLWMRGLASRSSIDAGDVMVSRVLPWQTKGWVSRVITDHLHPLLSLDDRPDVWYYPKGFLPALHNLCTPSVVTIHDTIVQYYGDRYPHWRYNMEYRYWTHMLRHTLTNADHILTVSETSKRHILAFMARHGIGAKEITVTYEPCIYESVPQPVGPEKGDYVLHLASREPHKRTEWLVDWWLAPENAGLPVLHLVGRLPDALTKRVAASDRIRRLPFLDDGGLRAQFMGARALIFPSEIEGFGLPAIEAYYLGTPVCFVKDTSVEEILACATAACGFHLDDPATLRPAIDEALAMPADEVRRIGLKLRETYAAEKVVDRMVAVFEKAAAG
jgi:glycosyltransferase involved in cell wall biosynthesis